MCIYSGIRRLSSRGTWTRISFAIAIDTWTNRRNGKEDIRAT